MNFEQIRNKVEALLPEILAGIDAFLVEVSVKHDGRGTLVRVLIDTDAGITIDQCAHVSRELGRVLDTGSVFEGSYRLEVSSPGIDQPLKFLRQYGKNVGRRYTVRYRLEQETHSAVGTLEKVEGDQIHFHLESGEPLELTFDRIIEAKEILPW